MLKQKHKKKYRRKHNYKKIDQNSRYKFRDERLQTARALGYNTIAEGIIKTYRKTKSAGRTGEINGGLSSTAIYHFLAKCEEPIDGHS